MVSCRAATALVTLVAVPFLGLLLAGFVVDHPQARALVVEVAGVEVRLVAVVDALVPAAARGVARELAVVLGDALAAQWVACVKWCAVVRFVFDIAWPHVRTLALMFANHQRELGPVVWAVEAAAVVVALLVWQLKRWLARHRVVARLKEKCRGVADGIGGWYSGLLQNVRAKSAVAAKILPHSVYWLGVAACYVLAPSVVAAVCEPDGSLAVVSVLYPAVRSVVALLTTKPDAEDDQDVLRWVSYWAVFGLFAFVYGAMPFGEALLALVPGRVHQMAFFFFLWVHLPGSGLRVVLGSIVVPVLNRVVTKMHAMIPLIQHLVPSSSLQPQTASGVLRLLDTLASFGVIRNEGLLLFLKDLVRHAVVVATAAVSIAMPTFGVGLVAVAVGIPTLQSVDSIALPAGLDRARCCRRWLTYWVVLVLILAVKAPLNPIISLIPFSTSLQVLVLVWLQLPFFNGASVVLETLARRAGGLEKTLSDERRRSLGNAWKRVVPGSQGEEEEEAAAPSHDAAAESKKQR